MDRGPGSWPLTWYLPWSGRWPGTWGRSAEKEMSQRR